MRVSPVQIYRREQHGRHGVARGCRGGIKRESREGPGACEGKEKEKERGRVVMVEAKRASRRSGWEWRRGGIKGREGGRGRRRRETRSWWINTPLRVLLVVCAPLRSVRLGSARRCCPLGRVGYPLWISTVLCPPAPRDRPRPRKTSHDAATAADFLFSLPRLLLLRRAFSDRAS